MFKFITSFFGRSSDKTAFQKAIEANKALHQKSKEAWDAQRAMQKLDLCQLSQCYSTIAGNIYYTYSDILTMPVSRKVEFEKNLRALSYGLTDNFMSLWAASMQKAIETNNQQQQFTLLNELKQRHTTCLESDLLLKIAMLLIVRHDENPYTYNASKEAEKKKEALDDADLHAFFLTIAYQLTQGVLAGKFKDLSIQSEQDFLVYLAEKKNPTQETTN
jgi:hypothetical protein